MVEVVVEYAVSTLSRPKAAGSISIQRTVQICFNTQPPEGGWAYTRKEQP